jgi:type IV pilus assembly protein PilB
MEQQSLELKNVLFTRKILARDVIDNAYNVAKKNNIPLLDYLIENNLINSKQLLFYQSELFGLPVIDLEFFDKENYPKDVIPEKIIKQHNVFPLSKAGNKLYLAISNPANVEVLDAIRFSSDLTPIMILAEKSAIKHLVNNAFGEVEILFESDNLDDSIESYKEAEEVEEIEDQDEADDTPVVKYVHSILLNAVQSGASDIHFEPYEKQYRVRQRTDGILEEVSSPPLSMSHKIASRIKIMSGMDISEKMKPQDGRIKLKISKSKAMDFRVNTLPTLFGEKIVLRLLDSSSATLGIDALGFEDTQKKLLLDVLNQPQGMILVTGPTGSGKTVTLYTSLNILNSVERNISTVEDPVEINLQGVNQVNVNNKQGLDFSQALRSFLRQDPDIIMVGEIRDLETADIAIKAAQTGHMVLSTLHTNSASETIVRLMNMGVASFNVATSINLIIAQRLARRLCPLCKVPHKIPVAALKEQGFTDKQISKADIYKAKGCKKCSKGYKGRIGVYEVVKITTAIQNIIMNKGDSLEIQQQAQKEGFLSIRQSGIQIVLSGISSLEEINRVTLKD